MSRKLPTCRLSESPHSCFKFYVEKCTRALIWIHMGWHDINSKVCVQRKLVSDLSLLSSQHGEGCCCLKFTRWQMLGRCKIPWLHKLAIEDYIMITQCVSNQVHFRRHVICKSTRVRLEQHLGMHLQRVSRLAVCSRPIDKRVRVHLCVWSQG